MKYEDCFEQINNMLINHHNEASQYQDLILNPDFDMYEKANKLGLFRIYCCLDKDEIVGYLTFVIYMHNHHKQILVASDDIYYMKPEYRKGFNVIKLFKFAEKHLKSIGVSVIKYTMSANSNNSKLFEFMGCKLSEKIFVKKI